MNSETKDSVLIRCAQKGDLFAFECLVKKYEHRVFSIVYRLVADQMASQDLTQDIFIKLFHHLYQFNNEKKFFTWFYRIIVNTCYDYLKREKFISVPLQSIDMEDSQQVEEKTESKEIKSIIEKLLDHLTTTQRTVFILREMEQLSCKEIAKILKNTTGTVRSHLSNARAHLKELIEKNYPEYLRG